jgi:hypothetical protein
VLRITGRLLKGINESFQEYWQEFNQSNDFWVVVSRSLQDGVVVKLANSLDTRKDVVSLPTCFGFLKSMQTTKRLHLVFIIESFDFAGLEADKELICANATAGKILQLRRNFLAHKASHIIANHAMTELPSLSNAELDEFIELLYEVAMKYCGMYGIDRMSRHYSDDYKRTLELVRRGLATED